MFEHNLLDLFCVGEIFINVDEIFIILFNTWTLCVIVYPHAFHASYEFIQHYDSRVVTLNH